MNLKYELQHVISGTGKVAKGDLIQTISHHLSKSQETGGITQKFKFEKEQEAQELIQYINLHKLWYPEIDKTRFIARGAEQQVYLDHDVEYVIKLNDSIFYATWLDYFHSLLLHNFFFPSTAYQLIGFYIQEERLHAVVKQPFVEVTQTTDLTKVKLFLTANGFQLKKNNDYFSPSLGIILEDLHDENILTNNDTLFFVDTVFYLTDSFFD